MNELDKKTKYRYFLLYSIIIAFVLTAWICPITSNFPGIGIDPSMVTGFHLSDSAGLKFGTDITLTYGPLYFLGGPIKYLTGSSSSMLLNIDKSVYFTGNILMVIFWFLSIIILFYILFKNLEFGGLKNKIFGITMAATLFCIFLFIRFMLPEVLIILGIIILFDTTVKENLNLLDQLLLAFDGIILALLILIKFSYIFAALSLIVIFTVFNIISKSYKKIAVLVPVFFISLFLIWFILEKSFTGLFYYIRNGLIISGGYSEAVFRELSVFARYLLFYSIIVFIIWLALLVFSLIKKDKKNTVFLFLSFPILFLFFKEGFVRPDLGHYPLYFEIVIFLLFFEILILWNKNWKIIPVIIISLLIALPFNGGKYSFDFKNKIAVNYESLKSVCSSIDNDYFERNIVVGKEKLKQKYQLNPEILKLIDPNDKLDLFPFDVSMLYAYDLNWKPRPVFQSYVVYAPELDRINSEQFKYNDESPDKILYKIYNYENKYQIFDEPLVFMKLLQNYRILYLDDRDGWVLFERNKSIHEFKEEKVLNKVVTFGEQIVIPQVSDGYLFLKIDLDLNFPGLVKKLFYKSENLYITFYFKDNQQPVNYEFNRATGIDGFFISDYIGNIWDINNVFENQYFPGLNPGNISSIEINSDNELFFKKNIDIEFFKLYYPAFGKNKLPDLKNININKNERFKINIDKIFESPSDENLLILEGWMIDLEKVNSGEETGILFFKEPDYGIGNYLGSAYYGLFREDVANFYKEVNYRFSGFRAFIDKKYLNEGKNELFVLIHSENKEYYSDSIEIFYE